MKRQLIGLVGSVAALVLLASCTEDPTAALRGDVNRVSLSRTYIELDVGQSLDLQAQALDSQGNALATLPEVTSSDASVLTVTVNKRLSGDPLPERVVTIKAVGYGQATLTATAGGVSTTGSVRTWPAAIELTGVPDVMRSGETATLTVTPVDITGAPVAGVSGITLANSAPTVATLDTATKVVNARLVGRTMITASGPGGSTGEHGLNVVPGVPASAAIAAASFGAVAAGGTAQLQVRVRDALGNQNINLSEITSMTATSSAPGVATVATSFTDDTAEGERCAYVTVTGVAAGTADITGTITTSTGTFSYGTATVTVLAPLITVANPSTANGASVTINGSGFTATGFTTEVLVDGRVLGEFTVVSATQIDAVMPTFGTAGTYDIEVSVGGVMSNADTWTLTAGFDGAATDPANDNPATAPVITVPFEFPGAFAGAPEEDDFYFFTVDRSLTLIIDLQWTPSKDLDILVTDGAFTGYVCTDGATGAKPEQSECDLDAGDYLLWLNDYDAYANDDTTPVTYVTKGTIQ